MAKPIYIYTGTEWVPVGPQIGNIAYNWIYTATGGETSLSGTDDNGLTLSYTPNYEQVYLNGVLLTRDTDYTTASSSSITGLSALTNGDVINVLVLETTTVDNTYTQNQTDVLLNDKADLASPALTGTPTAPTATQWDASTQIATTEFVNNQTVGINQFAAAGSSLLNLPSRVHPGEQLLKQSVLWIDSAHSSADGQEIQNLGWGGSALNAQLGSTTGADSNDPKYLDWKGENYVYLPGVSGNYLSVPDEAALDITGDIDIRVQVAMDDWTPATSQTLVSKRELVGDQRSFNFSVNPSALSFSWFTSGTSASGANKTSTVGVDFPNGSVNWVRVTLDVDNGTSGNDVTFFTSSDGVTWSQLGATVTTAGVTSIYSGTASVWVGTTQPPSSDLLIGKIYRAQILDGIDGTPVLDIDTSQISSGSDTSFPALTGQTVSINRSTSGRKSVAVTHPVWLFGTDDYMEVADNDLIDFDNGESLTVLGVYRVHATVDNNDAHFLSKAEVGTLTANTNLGYRLMIRRSSSSLPILYVSDGSANVGNVAGDAFNVGDLLVQAFPTTLTGDSTNSKALFIGKYGTDYADMEFVGAAVFRRALTTDEIATLTNYFNGRIGA